MNITSRQLKAFVLTARHQSFSRAAEKLFITQSGMSLLVRELEAQLGFRLFERTTRRVTLTEFGARFLPIADRSILQLEAAASNIGRSAESASHRLSIGATPLIAAKLLPAAIAAYATCNPEVHVVLQDGERSHLIAMVSSGELDVGLGCFLAPVPDVRRIALFRFSLMLIEPSAQPSSQPARPMRWVDIVERKLLSSPADNPIQQLIDRNLQRFGPRDPPDKVFTYWETQIAMVEAGAGSAVIPTFAIPACRERKVAMYPLIDPAVPIELSQIVSRGRKLRPEVAGFGQFLKRYIAEWAEPWSPGFDQPAETDGRHGQPVN
jgi:DNA-binding transcriptional LysR family regulator